MIGETMPAMPNPVFIRPPAAALLVVGGLAALWINPTNRLPDVSASVPAKVG
jgi:putative NADH-flavin reductase